MSKITLALEILSDGKWHEIKSLQQKLELSAFEVQKIMTFLEEYGFTKIDDSNRKVKIRRDFQKLLAQTIT